MTQLNFLLDDNEINGSKSMRSSAQTPLVSKNIENSLKTYKNRFFLDKYNTKSFGSNQRKPKVICLGVENLFIFPEPNERARDFGGIRICDLF